MRARRAGGCAGPAAAASLANLSMAYWLSGDWDAIEAARAPTVAALRPVADAVLCEPLVARGPCRARRARSPTSARAVDARCRGRRRRLCRGCGCARRRWRASAGRPASWCAWRRYAAESAVAVRRRRRLPRHLADRRRPAPRRRRDRRRPVAGRHPRRAAARLGSRRWSARSELRLRAAVAAASGIDRRASTTTSPPPSTSSAPSARPSTWRPRSTSGPSCSPAARTPRRAQPPARRGPRHLRAAAARRRGSPASTPWRPNRWAEAPRRARRSPGGHPALTSGCNTPPGDAHQGAADEDRRVLPRGPTRASASRPAT